jgi:hypothetical protein
MNFLKHPAIRQLVDIIDTKALDAVSDPYYQVYDGYGPYGYEQSTGILSMMVNYSKNENNKVVRTVSVSFSSITGAVQNFNIPLKVTVTEM